MSPLVDGEKSFFSNNFPSIENLNPGRCLTGDLEVLSRKILECTNT